MRSYPAKLLLFGEHLLLTGAPALAVPISRYSATWAYAQADTEKNARLLAFAQSPHLTEVPGMAAATFRADLEKGLFLQSNIPTGYGLGSSGALCAAIYDTYCREKTSHLPTLKAHLASMECFFHGSSSGIDPLTSYLNRPVRIDQKTAVSLPEANTWAEPPVVFLLDSTLPRLTGPLVQWFLARSSEADFAAQLGEELLPAHLNMVAGWLQADPQKFWPALRQVSAFQLTHMPPMIPPTVREAWIESLHQSAYSLKICGAGGGGFVLGFAQNRASLAALEQQFNCIFPFLPSPVA